MRSRRHLVHAAPRAYTLIELLIVVALLGVASALLVPRLIANESLTVQAAVRQLIADMSFAQSDALAHQSFRRLVFLDANNGYALLQAENNNFADFDDPFDPDTAVFVEDPLAFGGEQGRYVVEFDKDDRFEGVVVESVDLDGGKRFLTYDALGGTVSGPTVPGTGGTIVLAYNANRYEVTVAPFTGKLTVRRL
jgi:prepilin-type N-terminal cleavage/methylation domain-containing protein